MSENWEQSINQPLARPAEIRNFATDAAFTGSTDTAVLEFAGAASVNTGGAFTETTTAANGTIVGVVRPGLYVASLFWSVTGAVSIGVGIGVDLVVGAGIVADPAWATAGIIAAMDPITGVAALTLGDEISATFTVTQAQAAGTGRLVRFLATNSAGAAPVGLILGSMAYRITKVAEIAA